MGAANEAEILLSLVQRLQAAAHGESAPIIAEGMKLLNIGRDALYKRLREYGYRSGRRRRSDAGRLSVSEEVALKAAGLCHLATRANGKANISVSLSAEVLAGNGMGRVDEETGEIVPVSPTTLARAMRAYNCHPEQLAAAAPAKEMKSKHPNHVWQIDASVCVVFYTPGGVRVQPIDETDVYKNKPENIEKIRPDLCIRWLASDHCTDAFFLRYIPGGENAASFIDFFIEAIQQRPGEPFYGVPEILVMDPGAYARAKTALNMLERLGVKVIVHRAKNARAKGTVEGGHNRVENGLEGRFALQTPQSLEELNSLADRWRRAHCATRRHARLGMTRWAAWSRIRAEQLRLAPPPELCRELVTTEAVTRDVSPQLTISYACPGHGSRKYRVGHIPGAVPKAKLRVVVNPYRAPDIDVLVDTNGVETAWTVSPVELDEWNFAEDGHVWGEAMRALPDTPAQTQLKRILKDAYGVDTNLAAQSARQRRKTAYAGEIDAYADVKQAEANPPAWLPRRGTEHEVTVAARSLPPTTVVDVARALAGRMDGRWNAQHYARLTQRYPTGEVPGDDVAALEAEFIGEATAETGERAGTQNRPGGLRAVGGA